MSYAYIDPPPGVFRNGTEYEATGRWYESSLVRWHEGVLQPIGGWQKVQASSAAIDLDGPILGIHAWEDNSASSRFVVGTDTECHAFVEGVLTDITPAAGFSTGNPDATTATLYGSGTYGAGIYGAGDPALESVVEAQSWQFDNFGEIPIALAFSDGNIWEWDLNVANNLTLVTNAPTNCAGIVVTPERFLVALGASNDPRLVSWSDQEDRTVWTAASTNKAGDFPLSTEGRIMTGRAASDETLIWTTRDVWSMRFIGGTLVYRFDRKGSGGVISRRAIAEAEGRHFWMGHRGFHFYNGFAQDLPSDVSDYVFSDINRLQASKIWAVPRVEFNEVRWYYCSAASTDIDRMVSYNYKTNAWAIDMQLKRTAGVDRGVFNYPMECDALGAVYDHERGTGYVDTDDSTTLVPYAETGPFELGKGDHRMMVRQVIPDENTLGDVSAILYARDYPTSTERNTGTLTLSEPTSTRISGRQVKMRVQQVSPKWRVGRVRLELTQGAKR